VRVFPPQFWQFALLIAWSFWGALAYSAALGRLLYGPTPRWRWAVSILAAGPLIWLLLAVLSAWLLLPEPRRQERQKGGR